jgi:hypothetical protein
VDDDAVLAPVAAVEDDGVAVDSPDREVALALGDDDAARIRAGGKDDLVAGRCQCDRILERRCVVGNADLRPRRCRTGGSGQNEERRQPCTDQLSRDIFGARRSPHYGDVRLRPAATSIRFSSAVARYQPPCVRSVCQNGWFARMCVTATGFAYG